MDKIAVLIPCYNESNSAAATNDSRTYLNKGDIHAPCT